MSIVKTNFDFPDHTEMDEDEYQKLFGDDLVPEADLDFSEDFIGEHTPDDGIYESIEQEIGGAVDQAEAEIEAEESDDDAINDTEGLTAVIDLEGWLGGGNV